MEITPANDDFPPGPGVPIVGFVDAGGRVIFTHPGGPPSTAQFAAAAFPNDPREA
jgi:hypothetical protein